jgi:hypothetical protein
MKLLHLAIAAAVPLAGLIAGTAQSQDWQYGNQYDRSRDNDRGYGRHDRDDDQYDRGDRWDRGRWDRESHRRNYREYRRRDYGYSNDYGYRSGNRHCRTVWRYGHRERVCWR